MMVISRILIVDIIRVTCDTAISSLDRLFQSLDCSMFTISRFCGFIKDKKIALLTRVLQ